jgi:SIR2-like domain
MTHVDFESLAEVINSGSAVCLLGAGFSLMANQGDGGNAVPDTALLTSEIKQLMGVNEEEYLSLSDAAEICQDDSLQKSKLNSLLIRRLTSTVPTADQKWLVNLNWRAVFTTNFDDVIEQSRDNQDFMPITPTSDLSTASLGKLPIYYLHGRALDLREQDKDPSFVISESNYLELGSKNKLLYARLFNEIICARAVILIGYSLRDLEIAKGFLNKSGALREKTLIVTRSLDRGLASKRLEKFGTVVPIGLDGFRSELVKHSTDGRERQNLNYLREFVLGGENAGDETEITGDDFLKSVIVGRIDPIKYALQARSPETPYCVKRSRALEQIVHAPQQRFIVSSDFGNGKTAFLDQLAGNYIL